MDDECYLTDRMFTYTFRDGGKLRTAIRNFALPFRWRVSVGFRLPTERRGFRFVFGLWRAADGDADVR